MRLPPLLNVAALSRLCALIALDESQDGNVTLVRSGKTIESIDLFCSPGATALVAKTLSSEAANAVPMASYHASSRPLAAATTAATSSLVTLPT